MRLRTDAPFSVRQNVVIVAITVTILLPANKTATGVERFIILSGLIA
jgi:hypothetical protein